MNFEIHCSHSLFFQFPYRQDQALTVTGSHFVIGFKCTEGRATGFIGMRDWVMLAAASSDKSRRSYAKNRGCEQSNFENNLF